EPGVIVRLVGARTAARPCPNPAFSNSITGILRQFGELFRRELYRAGSRPQPAAQIGWTAAQPSDLCRDRPRIPKLASLFPATFQPGSSPGNSGLSTGLPRTLPSPAILRLRTPIRGRRGGLDCPRATAKTDASDSPASAGSSGKAEPHAPDLSDLRD